MSEVGRNERMSKSVARTGFFTKTTAKELIKMVIADNAKVISTRGEACKFSTLFSFIASLITSLTN